jgi:hypothetical protein
MSYESMPTTYNSHEDWLVVSKISTNDVIFLKKMVDTLVDKFNIESCTHNKSTTGEGARQYDLFNYMNDSCFGLPLVDKVRAELQNVLERENRGNKDIHLRSAWTVFGYENSFHSIHKHNQKVYYNHIATVIYLDVPDVVDKNRSGAFYAVLQDYKKENYTFVHRPVVGNMLTFPIWICHGSEPQPRGLRQTLNLDFEIE